MLYLLYFFVTADEITKTMNIKDEVWNELKENVKALKEPNNILFLGCLGTGKSSCINTMITALTGKYNMYADVGAGTKHSTTRLHRFVQKNSFMTETTRQKRVFRRHWIQYLFYSFARDLCVFAFLHIIPVRQKKR